MGKTIREIDEISLDEYNEWVAYFIVLEEREKNGRKNELRITLLGVDQASGPLRSVQQQVSKTTGSLNGATSSMKAIRKA